MTKSALKFEDIVRDEMFTTTLSSSSVITGEPVRLDFDIWLVVRCGSIRIATEVAVADIPSKSFSVFSRGRIIEVLSVSDDLDATVFILPARFQEELDMSELYALGLQFALSPVISLDDESMAAMEEYHRMCVRIIGLKDNPRRGESLIHLTKAFYYGGGYYFFRDVLRPEPEDSTLTRFLSLVEKYAARQHETGFYADRLCLTSKYLSRLVKRKTGKTAKDIITDCVLIRSRTLLLNTGLTVQQIADQLGFPSQSVFGKFFKANTGMSPSAYRGRGDILSK